MTDLAERIRKMAELIEPEYIAASLKLPLEVVQGVLNGEIPDDVLERYDPARPPDIKIVEKKRYVRNKTIAVYGPGGTGATTIAGLLALVLSEQMSVCAVDLSEYSALAYYLGINCWKEKAVNYPNILWPQQKEAPTEKETLKVIPGAATLKKHQEINWAEILRDLDILARQYETVIIDLPHNFELAKPVIDYADCVILVLKHDTPGINSLWQLKPVIENYLNKTYIVFNKAREAKIPNDIKGILEYAAGRIFLQEDPKLKFDAFDASKTEFMRTLKNSLLPALGYEQKEEPKKLWGIFKL